MSNFVPVGWVAGTLNEYASVKGGKRLPKGEAFSPIKTPFPYIRVTDFRNGTVSLEDMKYVSKEIREEIKRYVISSNDLYISIAGTLGLIGEIPNELDGALLTENAAKIVFKDGSASDKYFYKYFLSADEAQNHFSQEKGTGGGVPKLALFRIEDTPVLSPPLPEQQKIGSILTAVDDVIESTQAKINKLKDLKTGMMQELLTKGVGHKEFKPLPKWATGKIAEIDEIPSTWNLVNILSVAKLESGHTPSRNIPEYWGGNVPWVSLHDTKQLGVRVIHATNLYITQEGLNNSSARLLPEGTVAFSTTASVGHCVIFGREMATSQDFANYICGPELSNRYLLHLFKWMQHVWSNLSEGSTHQTIYMPIFKRLQILLPPLSEQIMIAAAADKIDDSILFVEKNLLAYKNMKKALMQDLLTGKVRVKVN